MIEFPKIEKKPTMPRVRKWKKAALHHQQRGGAHYDQSGGSAVKDEMLNPIKTMEPNTINAVIEDGEGEEIELAVNSGATESVAPESLPASVPTVEGPASKRGVMYEVASGHQIPNEGENCFCALTEEGAEKKMTSQVVDVSQGLVSVSKAMKAGNRIVFDAEGSYIESKRNGDKTWMREKNGMFMLKFWVKRPF